MMTSAAVACIALMSMIMAVAHASPLDPSALQGMDMSELRSSMARIQSELARRAQTRMVMVAPVFAESGGAAQTRNAVVLPSVQFVHKSTYATADPAAAAEFAKAYLGADLTEPNSHKCGSVSTARWSRANANEEFCMHFVFNPNKYPGAGNMNATNLGIAIERLRGRTFLNDTFDQWMDTHVGIVVSSLDPFVALWKRDGVPFQCRTWCCAAGMSQFPDRCPVYSFNRTKGCETGCYVQIPHSGHVVEMQCGLDHYDDAQSCLTLAQPETFDLCSTTR